MSLFGSASLRVEATQSIPHRSLLSLPAPFLLNTRTDQMRAPGAAPATPKLLSIAAAIPATCVPCPFWSSCVELGMQDFPPTTLRSGWGPTPLSMMAMFAFTDPRPSPDFVELTSASMRSRLDGRPWHSLCPAQVSGVVGQLTGLSAATYATAGSAAILLTLSVGMLAAYPRSALLYVSETDAPTPLALFTAAATSDVGFSTTMYAAVAALAGGVFHKAVKIAMTATTTNLFRIARLPRLGHATYVRQSRNGC